MMGSELKTKLIQLGLVCAACLTLYTLDAARARGPYNKKDKSKWEYRQDRPMHNRKDRTSKKSRSDKPNIILVLTDDQDELLGSMKVMRKTLKIMGNDGVHFNNSFVSTPMCCPSRSSTLTGLYPHNHHVYTNNDNCSGIEWQREHEPRTFAKYLSDAGYRTGFFGKYLNEYNGTYIPPGWREWVGLIRNSRFYNYTINFNGRKIKHDDNYYKDYFTDLIANDSVTFLKQSKQYFPTKPVMMMLSVPAPHGPEDAAPQYQHLFEGNTFHRTPAYNYMNNSDKQWLLTTMKPMEPIGLKFTDTLQQKRLQTLQSVDDLVEKLYYELKLLDELDNTYIIYTSDHGYHLGQFGILKGKALPYDFDIRVPLYIRGPGLPRNFTLSNVVANVDVAPTILDMAGVEIPDHMDGRSMLKLLKSARDPDNVDEMGYVKTKKPWRDTVLIERGKISTKQVKKLMRANKKKFLNGLEDINNFPPDLLQFANPKLRRMLVLCSDPENQPPCKPRQRWVCITEDGKKRLMRCRNYVNSINNSELTTDNPLLLDGLQARRRRSTCDCRHKTQISDQPGLDPDEELAQREFLKKHVRKEFDPQFIRSKRSTTDTETPDLGLDDDALSRHYIEKKLDLNTRRCRFLPNNTLICDKDVTTDPKSWKSHKERLDEMIEEARQHLINLKLMRKHLKEKKPTDIDSNETGPKLTNSVDGEPYVEPCNCDEDMIDPSLDLDDDIDDSTEDYFDPDDYRGQLDLTDPNHDPLQCQRENMKCSHHDNGHWKTPPYWTETNGPDTEDIFGLDFSSREDTETDLPESPNYSLRRHPHCKKAHLDCKMMDNTKWKTPPLWTYGPFCFCTNSNNNTYWCLRTVNQTHDFLFCEFFNNFMSFYNMTEDPFQLRNSVHDLNYGVIQQLHEELVELRACQGAKDCTVRAGMKAFKWKRKFENIYFTEGPAPTSEPKNKRRRHRRKIKERRRSKRHHRQYYRHRISV